MDVEIQSTAHKHGESPSSQICESPASDSKVVADKALLSPAGLPSSVHPHPRHSDYESIDEDLLASTAAWVNGDNAENSEDHVPNFKCWSRPFFSIARFCSRLFGWYPDSLAFSFRFCVTATAAALFYLLPETEDPWARVVWIYVTATVLAWQPHRDLSSVLKLSLDQTVGVVIGASLGLAVGFVALTISDSQDRKLFLALSVAAHGILFPYVCDRNGYRGSPSAVMSTPTFGIVALAFHDTEVEDPWLAGFYRVVTIMIACAIVIVAAFVCFPVSTHSQLAKNTTHQLRATGEFVEKVLDSAFDVFSKNKRLPNITDILMGEVHDEVYSQYTNDMDSYNEFKRLLSMGLLSMPFQITSLYRLFKRGEYTSKYSAWYSVL